MDQSVLLVSHGPHVRSKNTTQRIMLDVLIALVPALIASVLIFGWRSLAVTAVCVLTCVVCEWLFERLCKRENTVADLSAAVTGVLLAFNLPVGIPLWQAAFGSLVAIVVVKQLFGGIGKNFANPAITARIVMLLSFAGSMSSFSAKSDAVSSATPLASMAAGEPLPSLLDLFLGRHGGSLGETCALAILLGGVYLLCRRVITWHTPVVFIGTVFVFTWLLGEDPLVHILTGGLMLGAFFMATDYSTTPSTKWGKVIFGVGCGLITVLIRVFGNYPEGVSFAILFMNILTPYISKWTRRKPFGGVKHE
ncbi:MAG: RnfABCDGE type electron transport complex subunit D [Ruminococcaceae bacterium]|nr:RnfABCDGE type electron transport complex subunit D [Oscillospiraceae bacterium]